jgi:hypothetical protein
MFRERSVTFNPDFVTFGTKRPLFSRTGYRYVRRLRRNASYRRDLLGRDLEPEKENRGLFNLRTYGTTRVTRPVDTAERGQASPTSRIQRSGFGEIGRAGGSSVTQIGSLAREDDRSPVFQTLDHL